MGKSASPSHRQRALMRRTGPTIRHESPRPLSDTLQRFPEREACKTSGTLSLFVSRWPKQWPFCGQVRMKFACSPRGEIRACVGPHGFSTTAYQGRGARAGFRHCFLAPLWVGGLAFVFRHDCHSNRRFPESPSIASGVPLFLIFNVQEHRQLRKHLPAASNFRRPCDCLLALLFSGRTVFGRTQVPIALGSQVDGTATTLAAPPR